MAYSKQYPEKPLVALRAFAQDRDMLELPLVDVLEAFENEIRERKDAILLDELNSMLTDSLHV